MQYLLLRLKSRSAREASRHVDFIGNCLTVSHKYLLHLPRRWVFLFCLWCSWTKWAPWVNLKFYLSLSGFPLADEHVQLVITADSQSRRSQIASYGLPIFNFRFIKFVFRISGSIKFWYPSWWLQYRRS